MGQTLIEAYGKTYSAGDVKLNILGRTLDGISKLKYGIKQEKKNLYGMSREPVSRGRGNITYEGSITLKGFEYDALCRAVPNGGSLKDIQPFTATPTYLDDTESIIKSDRLRFVEFTGGTIELKGGDTDVEIECELIIGRIDLNI